MAVAFSALSSNTGSGVSNTYSHTPSGIPRGVVVVVFTPESITSVTYGGQAMQPIDTIGNATGPFATLSAHLYALTSNIPTGTQNVVVTGPTNNTAASYCFSLTGAEDLEVIDLIGLTGNVANPSGVLELGGREAFCGLAFVSDQDSPSGVTPLSGWTAREEFDGGTFVFGAYTYDTIDSEDVAAGWTQSADDVLGVAFAVAEVVTTEPDEVVADFTPVSITSFAASITEGTPAGTVAAVFTAVDVTSFPASIVEARVLAADFTAVDVTGFDARVVDPTKLKWIVLGDSQSDEYKADDNRIDSGPWQPFVLNWLEQLARPDLGQPYPATHHRNVDVGAWGTRSEPRRTGHERNLARSGSQMDDVVADQLALAESIINAGNADVGVLFGTGNEWGNPFQTPYLLSWIYNGNGTLDSQGVPVTTRMETLFDQYDTVMTALAPILPVGLVVVMPPDYGSFPLIFSMFPDATRRGYVTSAVEYLHGLIEARAEAINVAEGRTAVVTIPYDHYIKPDIWDTADGTHVTVAGVELDYSSNSTDGNPYYFNIAPQSAIPHAGTIVNGVIANTVIAAANQLVGVSIQPFSDAEILENAGIEADTAEGGSDVSVEVTAQGAGSKTASAGSASDVNVNAAGAGSKTAQAGSAVTVDVDAQGAGSKTALAGSASAVDIATAGSGAKAASGGSASSVAIVAVGAGTAEETASGGSAVTVSIAATGDGTKAAQGASPAGVDVSAQGAGSKAVSGGSGASVGVVASGGGTAAEGVSGGSVALVDVLAVGGGAKATSGASGTSVEITTAQAGSKHASGGSASSLSVTATGGGTAEEVPPEGGSAVTVYVLTSGGGLKAVSLGSATLVSLVASGAGQKHASGGSAARVGVYTSAGGGQVLPFDVHPRNIIAGYGPGFIVAG